MITLNGKPVVIKSNPKQEKEINQWVKKVCDRVFSHYTDEEMDIMRKQNKGL